MICTPTVRAALDVAADTPATSLSTTGYVIDSLRCAAWAIQPPDALEDVLVALANRGCDADTTGAIAGGLLGITHGEAGIPPRWKDRLEYAPQLREAATRDSDNPLPRLTAAMVNHGLRRYATKGGLCTRVPKVAFDLGVLMFWECHRGLLLW